MQKHQIKTNTTVRAMCAILFLIGCAKATEPVVPPEVEDLIYPAGAGLEHPCKHSGECRPGLACTENQVCEPAGTQLVGQACAISAECQPGSYCESLIKGCRGNLSGNLAGACEQQSDCPTNATEQYACVAVSAQCKEAGDGRQGDICSTDGHCISGLSCAYQMGFFGFCTAGGTGDIRTLCTVNSDCQAGLICGPTEACMSLLELGEYYEWEGTPCDTKDNGPARSYFELPNADGSSRTDFFGLPYPNDIRLASGHAATSFPSAGTFTTDIDPVEAIATHINQELTGWSPAPTVVFRFSRALDYETLQTGPTEPELGIGHDGRNIFLVNIDSDSKDYGREHGYTWGADTRNSKTLCGNWLTVNPGHGAGLKPGDTYAVVLLKGFGVADSSQQFNPDNDLAVVLSDAAPADTAVARPAWEQYGSLRGFLAEKKIAATEVLNAAVFTVEEESAVVAQARQIIRDLPPPQVISSVLCKPGVVSPCSDGVSTRECGENDTYYEIQGQLKIPVFQTGEAPYLKPEDGGALNRDGSGKPQGVYYEHVCFSLSVPKTSAMPAKGWPLILYGHDLGQHFRSHLNLGFARQMAEINSPAAVLGIDAPLHGTRKKSTIDSRALYQNLANIAAIRGATWQSAIDYLSVTFFAESLDANLGLGMPTRFDKSRFAYVGQGRGADVGLIFAAHEAQIGSLVLSGAGPTQVAQWLHRSTPISLVPGFARILRETPFEGDSTLKLIQHYLNAVDSINYGPLITKRPPEGMGARNLLYIYGSGDTQASPAGTRALADAMGLNIAAPALETAEGETFAGYESFETADGDNNPADSDRVLDLPISNNHILGATSATVAMSQFALADGDGHVVLHQHPVARFQVSHFLNTWFETGVAEIAAP